MASFDDFLKGFTFDPETFNADTFKAEIEKAHNDDLDIRDAKVRSMTEDIAKRDETIDKLKIKNYDLMMKVPTKSGDDNNPDNKGKTGDGEIPDVEDFFHD